MIGGTSPVIIFNFPNAGLLGSLGIPTVLPIYLDEATTGVMSDNAEDTIKIETQIFKNIAYQRRVNHNLNITLRVIKDNIVATTLLSVMSKIYELINSTNPETQALLSDGEDGGYFVTIYYDSSFMLKGYLNDYRKNTIDGTNQIEVKMSFGSIPQKPIVATILPKVENAIDILARG